jgi:protein ImuB
LRLDPGVRAGLESVGLRTVGSVMTASRAPLVRRFGAALLVRLDQALGRIEEAISPRLPVASLSVERHFAEPIVLIEDIERLVLMLSAGLKRDLERRGEGARALELCLFRVDGAVNRVAVGASRPIREPRLIGKLFHERLAALETSIEVGYGFDLVRLSAFSTARFETEQGDLTGETAAEDEDIALFADRVRARLGRNTLLRQILVESHLPERAASLLPFEEMRSEKVGPPRSDRKNLPERPLRLFSRPEPIHVPMTEVPDGAPPHFLWRRAMHRVARAEGPERIAPEWWRQEQDAETRDYFRIEDSNGHRFWLYREGLYGGSGPNPRWYMQGFSA